MARKIEDIEGIGPVISAKLKEAGVSTTDALLEAGTTKKGREELASATGLDTKQILKFVNMADLFRVKGVAGQFAELLKAAGVDTVKELKTRNAANLFAKMKEVNEEKKLTRVAPSEKVISDWIEQAKILPGVVTY